MKKILNQEYINLENIASNLKDKYNSNKPFPHIVLDNFFNNDFLNNILDNFPTNLKKEGINYNNNQEKKLASSNSKNFGDDANILINYLNSFQFLNFLQNLTNIRETLIPDPYLWGGGFHELKNDGFLNVHADFNVHPQLKINRRLNLLIYLNKDWEQNYGGSLELWDKDMRECMQKITPIFNRIVIFNTDDKSFHGNPDKIAHPNKISRKSIALYYYTNGMPGDIKSDSYSHSTLFQKRPGSSDKVIKGISFKKLFGKIYIRNKNED